MNAILITALALAGLLIGWIERPIIVRLAVPPGEPPQCACSECGYQVAPAGPLPVPVLPASGRCPACRARTGPPPLATELATALLLGILAARVHPPLVLAAAVWLAVFAGPLAWIDAAAHRLPDVLTAPAYAGTTALLLGAAAASGHWNNLARAAVGGLGLATVYLILLLISPSGPGFGDVKLAASIGTLLAWFSWATLLTGVFAGFALGGVYAVALLALRRASRKQRTALGPFMITGAFLVIVAGTL
jgi:leader peptidase (prepilin peptidase)/N-methyltransferase